PNRKPPPAPSPAPPAPRARAAAPRAAPHIGIFTAIPGAPPGAPHHCGHLPPRFGRVSVRNNFGPLPGPRARTERTGTKRDIAGNVPSERARPLGTRAVTVTRRFDQTMHSA